MTPVTIDRILPSTKPQVTFQIHIPMLCIGVDHLCSVMQTLSRERMQAEGQSLEKFVSETMEEVHKQAVPTDENTINKFLLQQLQTNFPEFIVEGECSS